MLSLNRKNLAVITVLLISVTAFAPLCVGRIADQLPLVPGASASALKVDLTTLTPVANAQQIKANSTQILYYRNITLVLDSARNLDLNITVDEQVKPRIFGLTVTADQNMSLTIAISHAPALGETAAQQTLDCYIDLNPNATLSLQVQLKLNINATTLGQELNREIVASQLTWLYWNSTQRQWISVPSHLDPNGYLVCNTTHLSTWTVADITANASPTPAPSTTPEPTETASPSPVTTITPSSTTIIHIPDLPSPAPSNSTTPTPTETPNAPAPTATQTTSPKVELSEANNASSDNQLGIGVAVIVVIAVLTSAIVLKKKGSIK